MTLKVMGWLHSHGQGQWPRVSRSRDKFQLSPYIGFLDPGNIPINNFTKKFGWGVQNPERGLQQPTMGVNVDRNTFVVGWLKVNRVLEFNGCFSIYYKYDWKAFWTANSTQNRNTGQYHFFQRCFKTTIYPFLYQVICTQRINPDGTRVIVGSMYMGYDIFPTASQPPSPQQLGVWIGWSPNQGRKAPEIRRRSPIRGQRPRKSGEGSVEGARWAPPQKICGISNFKSISLVYSWKGNLEKIDFSKKT